MPPVTPSDGPVAVTGCAGYIGSHVTVLLLEQNIEVICIDNLDNSRLEVLEGISKITRKRPLFKNLDLKLISLKNLKVRSFM